VQRREEEKTGGTIHSSVMCLHVERERERREEESGERPRVARVMHCLKPTQPGRRSKREREADIDRREVIKGGGLRCLATPFLIRRSLSLQPTPFITKVASRQPLRQSCMNSPSHTGCAVAELHIHTQYR